MEFRFFQGAPGREGQLWGMSGWLLQTLVGIALAALLLISNLVDQASRPA